VARRGITKQGLNAGDGWVASWLAHGSPSEHGSTVSAGASHRTELGRTRCINGSSGWFGIREP
jgi:hypothetical protein